MGILNFIISYNNVCSRIAKGRQCCPLHTDICYILPHSFMHQYWLFCLLLVARRLTNRHIITTIHLQVVAHVVVNIISSNYYYLSHNKL